MIAIVGFRYRNYPHSILYRSCLPIYGIAIVRLLSFLFIDDFERIANISVAIKPGSTVAEISWMYVWLMWYYRMTDQARSKPAVFFLDYDLNCLAQGVDWWYILFTYCYQLPRRLQNDCLFLSSLWPGYRNRTTLPLTEDSTQILYDHDYTLPSNTV